MPSSPRSSRTPAPRAEADTFGLGTGRDGALTVTSAAVVVVNTYAPVTAAIAAGSSSVTVGARVGAGAAFTAGQVVMILQTHGGFTTPPISGSGAALALTSADKTGRYELARVFSVAGNVVTLTNRGTERAAPAASWRSSRPAP